ncbi:hypothetical protein [Cesiribacter sp. SM1]|uniref:hypothetical protein n=1 Tax=Cesiribacter sp. SM1 TaxID=2861196 RepID=UPI001CD1B481|nr:hypothetical protein [Cesiribacter sp. SM1]
MENIEINPPNFQSEYIRYINECFNHWGQDKEYDWAFNRKVGNHASDIMIIRNEEDEVIAGSAVTYRKLEKPDGSNIAIGIMTGSWTLPKARGRGCFSKIIQLSKELAGKRDVPYLTAFVTESNASFRRLRDAGSMLLPTSFLFSPEEPFADVDIAEISVTDKTEGVIKDIFEKFSQLQKESVRYTYTPEEFRQQYIDRPNGSEIIRLGDDYAIVEETYNVVRVLLITYKDLNQFEKTVKLLTNWALKNRSKKLLLFSTQQGLIERSKNIGFEAMQGYFTILSTSEGAKEQMEELMQLSINMGDKM